MSVEVKWTDKGATISTLNAVKEFPVLTNDDVDAAIADGRLETKEGSFMGKSYTKLLRHQVKKLARQIEKKQREEAKGSDGSSSSSDGDEEEEEVELREPKWSDKGATISDKNAVKEFPDLTMEAIESALDSGELESRVGNFMGKSYRKLLLHQVENLAKKLGGGGGKSSSAEKAKDEERTAKHDGEKAKTKDGERRKRIADIEAKLEQIEEKKRKLMEEKKNLEKEEDE